jgi:acetolactate synthase-1/3 small subunit
MRDDLLILFETGLMALPRSPLTSPGEGEEKEAEDVVDQSLLPPS